ncbi:MAG: hypothetical protein QOI64_646, partial [Solirubrobacteraceae bacterium]|nr:hypothetical protein [Solirubrobacteraceae bacterium]
MDFEATLVALHGLMGKRVSVHVRLPGSRTAPALMLVTGTLRAAPEVVEQEGGRGEVFFCTVGRGPGLTGFFLDRNRFRKARWDKGAERPSLLIDLGGGARLVVEDEEEA